MAGWPVTLLLKYPQNKKAYHSYHAGIIEPGFVSYL